MSKNIVVFTTRDIRYQCQEGEPESAFVCGGKCESVLLTHGPLGEYLSNLLRWELFNNFTEYCGHLDLKKFYEALVGTTPVNDPDFQVAIEKLTERIRQEPFAPLNVRSNRTYCRDMLKNADANTCFKLCDCINPGFILQQPECGWKDGENLKRRFTAYKLKSSDLNNEVYALWHLKNYDAGWRQALIDEFAPKTEGGSLYLILHGSTDLNVAGPFNECSLDCVVPQNVTCRVAGFQHESGDKARKILSQPFSAQQVVKEVQRIFDYVAIEKLIKQIGTKLTMLAPSAQEEVRADYMRVFDRWSKEKIGSAILSVDDFMKKSAIEKTTELGKMFVTLQNL